MGVGRDAQAREEGGLGDLMVDGLEVLDHEMIGRGRLCEAPARVAVLWGYMDKERGSVGCRCRGGLGGGRTRQAMRLGRGVVHCGWKQEEEEEEEEGVTTGRWR